MSDNNFQLPIILVHGIARFDVLLEIQRRKFNLPENAFDDEFQYFKNIKTHLEANGFQNVFHSNQDFAGSVDLRAEQLRDRVNQVLAETGASQVHLIAHSMGGLDARRMIVDFAMADKISALTTVGTPHLGTSLADHVIKNGGFFLMEALKKVVRLDLDGFGDLTQTACEEFNRRAEEQEAANQVVYQTYASFEDLSDIFVPLLPSSLFIRNNEGRNDGLVSFTSQKWKPELTASNGAHKSVAQKEFPMPADHLNQIGWWDLEEAVNPLVGGTLANQKAHFENKIKQVYLDIAMNL